MSCTFTKMRLLRESPLELSFVECLNLECIAQLSYIRGLHNMAHVATLPSHVKHNLVHHLFTMPGFGRSRLKVNLNSPKMSISM